MRAIPGRLGRVAIGGSDTDLSRNCYAWDARAPVNAILLR